MTKINYIPLRNHLIDVIKESQIKIGYTPNAVALYYPVASLNEFLGTDCDADEMKHILIGFCEFVKDELGEVKVSFENDRFCLTVSAEGVVYVHENVKGSNFLIDFIRLLTTEKDMTIDKILPVFQKYSDAVVCKEIHDDEFNYLVYFEDGCPDDYRYCIDIDFGHATYHRLTPFDYQALGFDDAE